MSLFMEDCLRGGGGHLEPSSTEGAGGVALGGDELIVEDPLLLCEGECLGTGGEEAWLEELSLGGGGGASFFPDDSDDRGGD